MGIKNALAITLMLVLPVCAIAGEREASGTIEMTASTGKIIIRTSNANSSCGNRYYLDPDDGTQYTKTMISMLLAAQLAGKKVWVNGEGECNTSYPFNNAYRLVNMHLYSN